MASSYFKDNEDISSSEIKLHQFSNNRAFKSRRQKSNYKFYNDERLQKHYEVSIAKCKSFLKVISPDDILNGAKVQKKYEASIISGNIVACITQLATKPDQVKRLFVKR